MKQHLQRLATRAILCLLLTGTITAIHAQADPGGPASKGQGFNGRQGHGIRGTVVGTSGANVALKTETGEAWTVITTDNTRVNLDRQPVKVAELRAGDEVIAMGVPETDKHELHALALFGASAAQVAKLKADLGKTYIVGRITAIDETKLTILRPDKVSQTINLDESTSLHRGGRPPAELAGFGGFVGGDGDRRGDRAPNTPNETSGGDPNSGNDGEAITLADVKVGDNAAGSGSVKAGVFIPTELQVNTPHPHGQRAQSGNPLPQ